MFRGLYGFVHARNAPVVDPLFPKWTGEDIALLKSRRFLVGKVMHMDLDGIVVQ